MNMENLKFRLRLIVRQILRLRLRVRLRRVHNSEENIKRLEKLSLKRHLAK